MVTLLANIVVYLNLLERELPEDCPGLDGVRAVLGEHPFWYLSKMVDGNPTVLCPERYSVLNLPVLKCGTG